MLAFFFGVLAVGALTVGMAFVISKTLPRMHNKASRFVLFFVVCVPFGSAYDYIKHWALGSHGSAMSWPAALILALLWAILCTFWGPQSHKSNTQ
jgi:hypothetical protein